MISNSHSQDRYPTGLATELYARTPPGDKLRSLIVDLHVWKGKQPHQLPLLHLQQDPL